ncbi:MAG: hypothetical protein WBY44_34875 [Bryobacteraceae bacterium]
MSLPLKFAFLLAITLALFNGQCVANCLAFPCQTQDDPSLPPCHQQHQHQPKVCAQPAAIADSVPAAQSLVFLATAGPAIPIDLAVNHRSQAPEWISPPDAPPPIPRPLRI